MAHGCATATDGHMEHELSQIDPIQFGRMIEAMERLTDEVEAARKDSVETRKAMHETTTELVARIEELESRFLMGKWTLVGIMLAVGTAAIGLKETLGHVWGILFR